ncbi:rhamnosyltransferase WsaF family glycosyltransferase [Leifsonia poae]|uniref:Uncharacterized protein n=2 Tax=Leifsonia poae TaxID=110933 RepID=A0A9W6H7D2_9MICO|nr:hypothetical protein [Leifsonia poae]GLJ74965.1 hypothetical protein GCM10017584_05380 [Leifsonia poae]
MKFARIPGILGDLVRANIAFLTNENQRGQMRAAIQTGAFDRRTEALIDGDVAAAPAAAFPFARLSSGSLALTGIRVASGEPGRLNLVVGEVEPSKVFAGIHTALTAAAELATKLGLRLRVVMLDATTPGNSERAVASYLAETLGLSSVDVVMREGIRSRTYGSDDIWLASHSKTAHAIQVACDTGVIDRRRVAYLIQDYEPGFSAWSTESVLARSTYHAGFLPVVNSLPLWTYLQRAEQLELPRELVFAPRFEAAKLEEAAAARKAHPRVRVLYYGRRSKHRNLFALGLSALRATALELGASDPKVEFVSAGEQHDTIDLGHGARLTSRGRIAWNDYFSFLSTVDVALSLQLSPHPSHPPFDAAISGALAVTNDFDGVRAGLHPRIAAVEPTTRDLSAAITSAVRERAGRDPLPYLPVAEGALGADWDDVVDTVAERLSTGHGA